MWRGRGPHLAPESMMAHISHPVAMNSSNDLRCSMNKTCRRSPASGASLLSIAILTCALPALLPGDAWAQRGTEGPP